MQEALKFGPFKQNVAWMLIGGVQDQKAKQDLVAGAKPDRKVSPADRIKRAASNAVGWK